MEKKSVMFVLQKYNRNSFAALIGALHGNEATREIPLFFSNEDTVENDVVELARKSDAVLACFSFSTFNLLEIAQTLRRLQERIAGEKMTNVLLLAGGTHPTGAPEETLKLGFDYAIVGEGEVCFPDFVQAFIEGKNPLEIQGTATLRNGQFLSSGRAPRANLDMVLPFSPAINFFVPVEITRGCARCCQFCQTSFLFGSELRHRSVSAVEKVVRWMVSLGNQDIRFVCPDSLSYGSEQSGICDLQAVENLLQTVSKIDGVKRIFFGSFPSEVWPGSVTPEGLRLIKKYCANDNIVIGAQSGSQRILDILHRKHTVEQSVHAIEAIMNAGFIAKVDFIFGLPGETEEDQKASISLMLDLAAKGAVIHSHAFIPLAGTPLAEAEPRPLSNKLIQILNRLAGQNRQFGYWRVQEERAKKIYEFRKNMRQK